MIDLDNYIPLDEMIRNDVISDNTVYMVHYHRKEYSPPLVFVFTYSYN